MWCSSLPSQKPKGLQVSRHGKEGSCQHILENHQVLSTPHRQQTAFSESKLKRELGMWRHHPTTLPLMGSGRVRGGTDGSRAGSAMQELRTKLEPGPPPAPDSLSIKWGSPITYKTQMVFSKLLLFWTGVLTRLHFLYGFLQISN